MLVLEGHYPAGFPTNPILATTDNPTDTPDQSHPQGEMENQWDSGIWGQQLPIPGLEHVLHNSLVKILWHVS